MSDHFSGPRALAGPLCDIAVLCVWGLISIAFSFSRDAESPCPDFLYCYY